jgi:peptidoglycan/LPS O-acetylase OafA/YrhL
MTNAKKRIAWFDALRGLALLWIIFYHFTHDSGTSIVNIFNTAHLSFLGLVKIIGLTGEWGVNIFIVLSGAGLTFAAINRPLSIRTFFARHLKRLVIPYYLSLAVIVLALLIMALVRAGHFGTAFTTEFFQGARLGNMPFAITAAQIAGGLLILPRLFVVPLSSAWFVALIVQLYFVFPLLLRLMNKLGRRLFFLSCLLVSIGIQMLLIIYSNRWTWLPVPQANVFLRLAEFSLGMILGAGLAQLKINRRWLIVPTAIFLWLLGVAFFPVLREIPVIAATVLVFAAIPVAKVFAKFPGLTWIGRRSLEIFLIHDAVRFVYNSWPVANSWLTAWPAGFIIYLGLIIAVAYGFTKLVDRAMKQRQVT